MTVTDTLSVRENISLGAKLSFPYLLMNTLAAVISCYGLFADSPAVVIGAMIVAMLVAPISALALALVDSDGPLLKESLLTLFTGIATVVGASFVLGWIHSEVPLTHEIMLRTSPNLFDLIVGLAAGAAGAYATVSPRLLSAFIGVAIATALVPPLCAAGILLAHHEYHLAFGAFSMAFSNVVAVQFSASVVMWFTGIRRKRLFEEAKISTFLKQNAITIIALVGLSVILQSNLRQVMLKQVYQNAVLNTLFTEVKAQSGNYLAGLRFEARPGKSIIRAIVRGPKQPTPAQVGALQSKLPPPAPGTENELRIRFVKTVIIGSGGELEDDTELDQPMRE